MKHLQHKGCKHEQTKQKPQGTDLGAVLSASTPYASSPALAKVKVESGRGAIHLWHETARSALTSTMRPSETSSLATAMLGLHSSIPSLIFQGSTSRCQQALQWPRLAAVGLACFSRAAMPAAPICLIRHTSSKDTDTVAACMCHICLRSNETQSRQSLQQNSGIDCRAQQTGAAKELVS